MNVLYQNQKEMGRERMRDFQMRRNIEKVYEKF